MSGIHKSKEVYKYTPTRDGTRKLVPVRGVYVSGLHTDPLYMDHCITITEYSSADVEIVDYTTQETTQRSPGLSVVGIDIHHADIIEYTRKNTSVSSPGLSVIGIEIEHCDILPYTRQSQTQQSPGLSVVGVSVRHFEYVNYFRTHIDSSLEYVLSVLEYTSSSCDIEDII